MTDITPERLAQIKARAEAATAGPWFTGAQNDMLYVIDGAPTPGTYDGPIPKEHGPNVVCHPNWRNMPYEANARFIAAARQDIPDLIDALEAAQAENAKLRAILSEAVNATVRFANITEVIVGDDVWKQITDATNAALEAKP